MPKKLFAVTNVKFSGDPNDFIAAGDPVDPEKFTKEQLVELHDSGAIEVRIVDVEPEGKEALSPLDDPDVEVKDETAKGVAKSEKEEAEAKKAAIDAELKAKQDAEKAATDAAKAASAPTTTKVEDKK